jgi:TonB family protein
MTTSELLLTFLLNACWQIALLGAAAVFGDWLLRRVTVRYRHLLWVGALLLAIFVPVLTSLRTFSPNAAIDQSPKISIEAPRIITINQLDMQPVARHEPSIIHVSAMVAYGLLALYLLVVFYRSVKLLRAWIRTRTAKRDTHCPELSGEVQTIVANCKSAFGVTGIEIVSSASLRAPATIGIFRRLVILPEELLREANIDALTAAIGHEMVHVARRDYLMNLIYELVFLPLSFHPAAALMRRRIMQTRELRCDELVAERLLNREIYARSLVQLARSATSFNRRGQTITVGITDADILEVRIMSLLKGTKLSGGKKFWLIAAAVLLALPCAAAAAFTLHLNIDPAHAQGPSSASQEKREIRTKEDRERFEQEMKARAEREDQELKERIDKETNQEMKAKLVAILQRRQAERADGQYKTEAWAYSTNGEGALRERQQEGKLQAELARMANISMDRAIQIAVSQNPGKVLECNLVGERSESSEVAKPSRVFYHVVILAGDESKTFTLHVMVNAIDGTISTVNKEGREEEGFAFKRRAEEEQATNGERKQFIMTFAAMNDKAVELPAPEYPAIAKAAHASGTVTVDITVDENGNVISAHAVSGHPLLQAAAVKAARQAKFTQTLLSGVPVKVGGPLVYNFVAQ